MQAPAKRRTERGTESARGSGGGGGRGAGGGGRGERSGGGGGGESEDGGGSDDGGGGGGDRHPTRIPKLPWEKKGKRDRLPSIHKSSFKPGHRSDGGGVGGRGEGIGGGAGGGNKPTPGQPSVAIDRGHRLNTPPTMRDFENRWPTSLPSGGRD